MKVLFLYPSQGFGQRIRVEAIARFFEKHSAQVLSRPLRPLLSADWHQRLLRFPSRFSATFRFKNFLKAAHQYSKDFEYDGGETDFIHCENHEGAVVGCFLKEKYNKPLIFDMHGLAIEEAIGRGDDPIQIEFIKRLERFVVERADHICVVSQLMADYLIENYAIARDRILIIPCGASLAEERARFQLPLNIVYSGGDGYYEKISDYIQTPAIFYKKYSSSAASVRFSHIGKFPFKNKESIFGGKVWGIKSRDETLKLLAQMQVGVAPSTNDLARRCASPVKIADYASCGLPIICPDIGDWSSNIRDFDAGIVCKKSSPEAFADAILELSQRDIWERKSKNCLKLIQEKYDWDLVLRPLCDIYEIRNRQVKVL